MESVSAPHDQFFEALLEQPGAAGALLRERLPEELASQLVGDPELIEGTFIDAALRESRTDRLYRLRLKAGASAFVYCLLEHKSAPDARVGLQLLRYMVRIWDRLDREAGCRGLLPPVIPLVVYHGAEEWKAPVRFSQMLDASETLKTHLLDFPFRVMDVGRIDDADLSRGQLLRAGLRAMKYSMLVTWSDRVEVVVRVLVELRGLPQGFVEQVMGYVVRAYGPVDEADLSEALKRAMPEKEEQMLSIAAKQWLAEGKAEGEAKGEAKALLKILEKRFSPVAEEYRERIFHAQVAEIETWLDRALDATSIEAVFAAPTH